MNNMPKIVVIGDSYRQFLTLSDKTPGGKTREPQSLWLKAGASRMDELIQAVCNQKPAQACIPHENAETQFVESGQLEEYEPEEGASEILDKLHIVDKKKRLRLKIS